MAAIGEEASHGQELTAIATQAGLFVLVHAWTVAAIMALLRRHLDGGLPSLVAASLYICALVGAILLFLKRNERKNADRSSAEGAIAIGAAIGYLLPATGLLTGRFALVIAALAASAGLLAGARSLRRSTSLSTVVLIVTGAAISGAIMATISNGEIYTHVLSREFTVFGWQAPDPVFHSAIAQLLINYGVFTVGLDGTSFLFYHVFSHVVAAGLAQSGGETPLLAYPAVQQVFLIPALLFGSALLAAYLSGYRRSAGILAPLATLTCWHFEEWLGTYNSFLVSESYTASLGLLSFSLPLLLSGPKPALLKAARWLATVGCLALLSIAAKFVLVFAWIAAGAYGILRTTRRQSLWLSCFVIAAAACAYGLGLGLLFQQMGGTIALAWFGFAHQLPTWLNVSLAVVAAGLVAALYLRRSETGNAPFWFLLAMALLLHIPDTFLWDRGGGGEYYWFHPSEHLAVAMIVAAITVALDQVTSGRTASNDAVAMILTVMMTLVAAINPHFDGSAKAFANTLVAFDRLGAAGALPSISFADYRRAHESARQILAPDLPEPMASKDIAALAGALATIAGHVVEGVPATVVQAVEAAPLAVMARNIKMARSSLEGARPGLFVGPENDWFWKGPTVCISRNFTLQALTGIALIAGIPPDDKQCGLLDGYGNAGYGAASQLRPMDDEEVCAAARALKLSPVLRVSGPDQVDVLCH